MKPIKNVPFSNRVDYKCVHTIYSYYDIIFITLILGFNYTIINIMITLHITKLDEVILYSIVPIGFPIPMNIISYTYRCTYIPYMAKHSISNYQEMVNCRIPVRLAMVMLWAIARQRCCRTLYNLPVGKDLIYSIICIVCCDCF